MSTVKHKRYVSNVVNSLIIADGEYVTDLDTKSIHVGDGQKAGGHEIPSKTRTDSLYQPKSSLLSGLAAVTVSAAGKILYSTATNVFAALDSTEFGRSILNIDNAAAGRALIGAAALGQAQTFNGLQTFNSDIETLSVVKSVVGNPARLHAGGTAHYAAIHNGPSVSASDGAYVIAYGATLANSNAGRLHFGFTSGKMLRIFDGSTERVRIEGQRLMGYSGAFDVFNSAADGYIRLGNTTDPYDSAHLLLCGQAYASPRFTRLGHASGDTQFLSLSGNTTASAANVFTSSSGVIARSTSSAVYKQDIEPLWLEQAHNFINRAWPIFYRSKASADNPAWSHYGYIAEELAEIEPRLVNYRFAENVKIRFGKPVDPAAIPTVPDGVQYERIVTLLHVALKDALRRIDELETVVESFKNNTSSFLEK